ncbi:RNA 2',3'-cyclic phosphodiesterase [bacterium]|nr:RNA 2',3'-cyclic phosphodiesterase [bacterium]
MPRLFIAIDLPGQLKTEISVLCAYGLPGVAWVDSDQLHLSLRFVGEVNEQVSESIQTCLLKVQQSSFSMTLQGVGTFPGGKSPRVIWVGVEKNKSLLQLKNKVEYQLNRISIEGEKRRFHPHVTIGRVKTSKIKRIGDYLAHFDLYRSEPFPVERISLFSSLLTPVGAKYTKLMDYPLR